MEKMDEALEVKAELERIKNEMVAACEEMKSQAKANVGSVIVQCIVAACVTSIFGNICNSFLPKNLSKSAKMGVLAASFFIPDFIGAQAANKVNDILKEK